MKGLRTSSSTHQVSFELRAGEILGMGGLVGAGRTELVRAIFGVDPIEEGSIEVDGKLVDIRSPRDAIAAGIQLVPEDRKAQGLILDLTLRENVALAGLPTYRRWGLLNRAREREVAWAERERLRIRAPGIEIKAKNLSGGNQQKVVLGKWLSLGAKVLILDEPTRGVDVGAKEEIYALLSRLAAAGLGILMVSSGDGGAHRDERPGHRPPRGTARGRAHRRADHRGETSSASRSEAPRERYRRRRRRPRRPEGGRRLQPRRVSEVGIQVMGITVLLAVLFLVTWYKNPNILSAYNLQTLEPRHSDPGTLRARPGDRDHRGGIDLSVGSLIGFLGVNTILFLSPEYGIPLAAHRGPSARSRLRDGGSDPPRRPHRAG